MYLKQKHDAWKLGRIVVTKSNSKQRMLKRLKRKAMKKGGRIKILKWRK